MSRLYHLRRELEFSTQTRQGKSYLVVKDPVTNRYFNFKEMQASIVELVREPIDIDSLGAAAAARLGATVKAASLEGFLKSLEEKHLLDTPTVAEKLAVYKERKPRGKSLLYMQLVSLNPERVLGYLLPKVGWCFTPAFNVFAAIAIICGFVITFLNAGTLAQETLSLFSLRGALMTWLVVAAVLTVHEFAHGLTCCHFGGKVQSMGYMLIYFSPAFFCDVSDAWMFPTRRERMWVTFAGGYFQLVMWGLAAIAWRVLAEDTLASEILLIVMVTSGIQTLFNFNPLIKLDGYYMLSDYLEIPNLREKGFRAFRAWLAGTADPLLDTPQRKALLRYGAISLTFSTLLLSFVYVNIYLLATSYFAFAGLVGFLMFSGYTLRRTAAEPVAGVRSLITRAMLRKFRNFGVGAAAVLAMIIVPWELKISADFRILPLQESIVRSETAGTVAEVLIREGSRVEAGEVIVRLYDFDKQKELETVSGELEQKQAELAQLRVGPRTEEIDQAEKLVDTKRVELENIRRNVQLQNQLEQALTTRQTELRLAEIELRRTTDLFIEELGSRVDMEKAQATVEVRRSAVAEAEASVQILAEKNDREEDLKTRELAEAESALALLRAGSRPEEIQQREAEVNMLEARQRILGEEIKKSEIRAGISGTVTTPFVQKILNRHLQAGEEVCRIVDMDRVRAEMFVPEQEMGDVSGVSVAMTMEARAQDVRELDVTLTFQGDEVRLDVPALGAVYVGALDKGGETISGTWRHADAQLPLTFDKDKMDSEAMAGSSSATTALAGVWDGTLGEGKLKLRFEPGMPVRLKARSFPTREFEGNVDFIAPVAEMVDNARVIKIRTELDNGDGMLKPDMTGVAKIHAGRRQVIALMTRRIIRWFRTESWYYLP